MANEEQGWITLARIVRPQGRRGEILADLFTDFPSIFTTTSSLVLVARDGARCPVVVENQWLPTGRSHGRVVLKLHGTDSISAAETLAGREIRMPRDERIQLEEQTWYVSDLVGCALLDGETVLGTVSDMHFPVTADGRRLEDAAPLFVVARESGVELLIPFANAFVQSIDTDTRRIHMMLPAGLLDLNG